MKFFLKLISYRVSILVVGFCLTAGMVSCNSSSKQQLRERISINDGWRFMKYDSVEAADSLIYDVRPEQGNGGFVILFESEKLASSN